MNTDAARSATFLRRALLADAAISGAAGLVCVLGAGTLGGLLHMPEPLLRYAGIALLPFTAFVLWVATRDRPARAAVWAVIVCNAAWAADSVLLLLSGWIDPSALGLVFIAVQAAAVAVFAELQYVGLRRAVVAAA
ncbi:MAG: hypothetical protein IT561_23615 [Alphaproteobacteria bacterium]|nr:hypothetical protein [Alphaproteobacteria bacterium]